jgi:hypothetical protein
MDFSCKLNAKTESLTRAIGINDLIGNPTAHKCDVQFVPKAQWRSLDQGKQPPGTAMTNEGASAVN